MDTDVHWPNFADKFGVNVVYYNASGGDLLTSDYKRQDNGLQYKLTLGFRSPSERGLDKSSVSSSTVKIVHVNSNHFMSVVMK